MIILQDMSHLIEMGYQEISVVGRGRNNQTDYYIPTGQFSKVYYKGVQAPTVDLVEGNHYPSFFFARSDILIIIADDKRYDFSNQEEFSQAKRSLAREVFGKYQEELGILQYSGIFDRQVVSVLKLLERGALILKSYSESARDLPVPTISLTSDEIPAGFELNGEEELEEYDDERGVLSDTLQSPPTANYFHQIPA